MVPQGQQTVTAPDTVASPVGVLLEGEQDAGVVVAESTWTEAALSPIAVHVPFATAVMVAPEQPFDG